MATVHEYKKLENSVIQKLGEAAVFLVESLVKLFKLLFAILLRPYTIVLVPHSEKRVYSLQISGLFFLCFIGGLVCLVWIAFRSTLPYETSAGAVTYSYKDSRLEDTQASLDELRGETIRLLRAAEDFETALSTTLSALGTDISANNAMKVASGEDLSAFFNISMNSGGLREVAEISRLTDYLTAATVPVKEIGTILDTQSALLNEIPSIWPIKGGIGHVSMFFGQNRHPFTGQ
ncbi:MAG: hypothetical protein LBS86_03655 [Treponema sp.]|nr:hypothetical protein [Treponema sp.]